MGAEHHLSAGFHLVDRVRCEHSNLVKLIYTDVYNPVFKDESKCKQIVEGTQENCRQKNALLTKKQIFNFLTWAHFALANVANLRWPAPGFTLAARGRKYLECKNQLNFKPKQILYTNMHPCKCIWNLSNQPFKIILPLGRSKWKLGQRIIMQTQELANLRMNKFNCCSNQT